MSRTKSIQGADDDIDWAGALSGAGPRYLQVLRFLERVIADGRLRPGDRLPPQRQLAVQLGIDLTTVTRAYAEARAKNLVYARGALGTFVSAPMVALSPIVDLSMNMPPPSGLNLAEHLKRGVAQVLAYSDADKLMSYQSSGGSKADRTAGARWLVPILGAIDERRISVAPGGQAALAGLILSLTKPGDVILTESMTYPGLLGISRQLGRPLKVVDSDEHGIRPDALAVASYEHAAHVVYLNPTLHNPTTKTMNIVRRRDIGRVASKHNLQIIEDDPYWLLANDPPPPLVHEVPHLTHYISTLSKCLAPGLRTAYVVSPSERAQRDLLAALRATTLMSSPLPMSVCTQWIHDGTAERILAGVRSEAGHRLDLAERLLAGGKSRWPKGGLHVWYALPEIWTSQELSIAARMEGLAVTVAESFAVDAGREGAIRISLGAVKDRAQLEQALKRLADLLQQRRPDSFDQLAV